MSLVELFSLFLLSVPIRSVYWKEIKIHGSTILWLMVNIWPIDLFGLAGLGFTM